MAFRMPEKRLVGLALIVTFWFLVEGAMADWGGIYLTTIGETPARAAAGYGAFSALMVAGRVLGDRIVRRFGRPAVISAGAAMAALGLVLATAVPTLIMIVAGFAMVGAGLSNVVPCVFSASAALGSTPAAGIATTSTAGYAGLLAGPPLIGAVAAHWGMRSGMGVIALAATAAVAISLRFRSAHQG
jgi:MFS family permease